MLISNGGLDLAICALSLPAEGTMLHPESDSRQKVDRSPWHFLEKALGVRSEGSDPEMRSIILTWKLSDKGLISDLGALPYIPGTCEPPMVPGWSRKTEQVAGGGWWEFGQILSIISLPLW